MANADKKVVRAYKGKWSEAFEEGKRADEAAAEARKTKAPAKTQAKVKAPKAPKAPAKAPKAPADPKNEAYPPLAPKVRAKKAPAPVAEAGSSKTDKKAHEARKAALHNYAGKPTLEVSEQFQKAYDHFNEELFNGKLPPMLVRLEPSKKWAGLFYPDRWSRERGDEQRVDELVINPLMNAHKDDRDILSTLVHEMAHGEIERQGNAPRRTYHCKRWCAVMKEIGLEPVITDRHGQPVDKPTGKNATHKIIPGGAFDQAFDWLAEGGFKLKWVRIPEVEKPKKASKPKTTGVHECPSCDEKARAKIVAKLICGACNVSMIGPEIEVEEEEMEGAE